MSVTSAPSSTFISDLNCVYVLPLTLLLPINRTSLVVNVSSDFKALPLDLPKVRVACFPSILLCKAELDAFSWTTVAIVASTAISLAFAVIPVPPTTFKVTVPAVPPPVKPSPAVTPVIVPPPAIAAANEADTFVNPGIDKIPLELILPEAVIWPSTKRFPFEGLNFNFVLDSTFWSLVAPSTIVIKKSALSVVAAIFTLEVFTAFATVVPAITEDSAVPLTVMVSASKVPSISASPLIFKLPVIWELPWLISPFLAINSFAILFLFHFPKVRV